MSSNDDDSRPLVGLALVAVAVFFFALSDVVTKHLTQSYPVPVVVAARYFASLALLMGLVWPRLGRRIWQVTRMKLVLVRGAILTVASLTMGLALKVMPVGETIAIMYLSPFAVMVLAVPLLKERITPLGVFLAVLGFAGVLLVLRPGAGLDPAGVVFALLNAACATAFHLITRVLTRTETSIALLFHVTSVGAVSFGILALPHLSGNVPDLPDLAMMFLLGGLATAGHFLFAAAYREAPASLIAPMNYMHLVWAALLGLVVFGHVPSVLTIGGMALIVFAGVAIAIHAHLRQRRRPLTRPEPEAP